MYCSPFSLAGWLRLPRALIERLRGRRAYRERTLLVVRHASAEPRRQDQHDRDRALSEQGTTDAVRLGALLAARALVPDVVVASTARRAVETAGHIVSASGFAGDVIEDERIYRSDDVELAAILPEVAGTARSLLLVGHEPAVSALVARLSGELGALPPGGMAVLSGVAREWEELTGAGLRMRLIALWRPADAQPTSAPTEQDPRGKWIVATPDEPVADVARRALVARLTALNAALAAAAERAGTDPDTLRKVRVAGRRVEAVLKSYRDLLPRRRRDRALKALRRLRRATRPLRDADILHDHLSGRATDPCIALLLASLDSARVDPRATIEETRALLGDADEASVMADIVAALERRVVRPSGSARFGAWALLRYEAIVARYHEMEASTPTDAASLHELRLAAKKLRYEIELLAAVLPTAVREQTYPALVEVQNRLGLVSDQATRVARLEALVADLDASHPRDALADVVATERKALEAARAAFLVWRENGAAPKK